MQTRTIDVGDAKVEITEAGSGAAVLYLHGIFDVHTLQAGFFPFHDQLAGRFKVVAPAHPGCGASTGIGEISHIEDLAFHYLDLLDALEIERATIVGNCLGGWIATEMAVRNPERVGRLVLIGAAGLQLPDAPVGDFFMYSQHRDGGIMAELRQMLFSDGDGELARSIVPDGRVAIPDEVRRYQSLTLAGRVGWEPPYLYDLKLARRLHRIDCPTLLLWGAQDRMIPVANGRAYAGGIAKSRFETVKGAGHSVILEQPEACLKLVTPFLQPGAPLAPNRPRALR